MIRVCFIEPCTSLWKQWRDKCETEQASLNRVYATGKSKAVSEKLYREQKEVYLALNGPFRGKCVYCEMLIDNQFAHLDHFRPKKRVTDFTGVVTIKDRRGRDIPHRGYYWLAYDFRNLLPACEVCNCLNKSNHRSGGLRIGKGNLFPVKGNFRAKNPGEEKRERPLLLNPTAKNIKIEKHLMVDEKGFIQGLTPEGKVTCKIFGLNDRQALIQERMAAYQNGYRSVLNYLTERGNDNVIGAAISLRMMIEYEAGVKPYSAAGRAGISAMFKKLKLDKYSIIPKSEVERLKKGVKKNKASG
jgi:hypothetical protein